MNSISISIPAYNDAKTIENVIFKSYEVVSKIVNDYEILVINDGSKDSTEKILLDIKNIPSFKIYKHKFNKGFGETIKEVFCSAKKEWVFFIPGDGQISPDELKKFYPFNQNYDFIIGWRKNRQDSFLRTIYSWLYNFVISIIGFRCIHDVNSVVFFKRKIIDSIKLNSKSAFIHAELYLKLLKKNYKIKEIEVGHNKRIFGKSGAVKLKVIFSTIKDLILFIYGRL